MVSKRCTYGLQVMLFLAKTQPEGYVAIREVSGMLSLPGSFLTKALQPLAASGLLETHRGPGGGIRLARSADAICVSDIVRAIDGTDVFAGCLLGLRDCRQDHTCPLAPWREALQRHLDASLTQFATLAATP